GDPTSQQTPDTGATLRDMVREILHDGPEEEAAQGDVSQMRRALMRERVYSRANEQQRVGVAQRHASHQVQQGVWPSQQGAGTMLANILGGPEQLSAGAPGATSNMIF
ncbi:unnamed protein product, partial [Amoebophrya sp. A25]